MDIKCDACACESTMEAQGPADLQKALPKGWHARRLDGRVFVLCDVCGHMSHFIGGISAYLQDRLGLDSHVRMELREMTDFHNM